MSLRILLVFCHLRIPLTFLAIVLFLVQHCAAAGVLFIRSGGGLSEEQREIQLAAEFYGVDLRVLPALSREDNSSIQAAAKQKEIVGVAIQAGALPNIDEKLLLRALSRGKSTPIPILIFGIQAATNPSAIRAWSGDTINGCNEDRLNPDSQYAFGSAPGVTAELSGIRSPAFSESASYLAIRNKESTQEIEGIESGGTRRPLFISSQVGRHAIFFACKMPDAKDVSNSPALVKTFLSAGPAIIFVRFCAGDQGWHALHHYANFTIDDPWLREPYGYLNYGDLLGEMEKHRFHTTIAFIPWNYDRSEPTVVSLFKSHPDLFSVAIHGNNHDHKEFTSYNKKPFADQVRDLAQGLARMDEFSRLTGISYDKVMVFPHSNAPERTLGALKSYNFLATANSTKTPEGALESTGVVDALRPVTLAYQGFPSIERYSTEARIPWAWIAINQFLGNPLLFYDHSDFFSEGIGAFDGIADAINSREPSTEWRGLGEIARNLYLVRSRSDGNYDVLSFSHDICLSNVSGKERTFYIRMQEAGDQKIESVTLADGVIPYSLDRGVLSLSASVPASGSSCAVVKYVNDLQLSKVNLSHDSLLVTTLRRASDFRDIYLAKSTIGLAFVRYYDQHQVSPLELMAYVVAIVIAVWCLLFYARKFIKRGSQASQERSLHKD